MCILCYIARIWRAHGTGGRYEGGDREPHQPFIDCGVRTRLETPVLRVAAPSGQLAQSYTEKRARHYTIVLASNE